MTKAKRLRIGSLGGLPLYWEKGRFMIRTANKNRPMMPMEEFINLIRKSNDVPKQSNNNRKPDKGSRA